MSQIQLALIGCGPHAKRVYLPAIRSLCKKYDINLALVVELLSHSDVTIEAIRVAGFQPEFFFVEPFENEIPSEISRKLTKKVEQLGLRGVIIATEPLVHKAYSEWALDCHLHILLDKPVTARANVSSCLISADGILADFDSLLLKYQNQQLKGELAFMVNTQRRVHPGFLFVERLLSEVGLLTNCPVTSIQSYHCDGQWRLPSEIVTQTYHPYCQGYGKASHSGYHIFDIMYRLFKASGVAKDPDSMEIISSFVQPNGFIKQFNENDYRKLFGDDYEKFKYWSDDELRELYVDFGEIDVAGIITLKHQEVAIANFNLTLLHNGFAQRTWLAPGTDLYKGNGRVKHEHHCIQQGPFQNIQIHSYQSNDQHNDTSNEQSRFGGNNHFDIHVFRNPLVAGKGPALRSYNLTDILNEMSIEHGGMLTSEFAKHHLTEQFISYLAGDISKCKLSSKIEEHRVPVQIMSGLYRSHILRQQKVDSVVRMELCK
ncbi:hypothetical protein [Vibrio metschnikovii]|uniref:hypothetical protein n=1 Tax=Vibrio metschnikovii TaxID=28172 RepID=UPI00165EA527|nr:hypothetical protein [Vibrio metschnikovii]